MFPQWHEKGQLMKCSTMSLRYKTQLQIRTQRKGQRKSYWGTGESPEVLLPVFQYTTSLCNNDRISKCGCGKLAKVWNVRGLNEGGRWDEQIVGNGSGKSSLEERIIRQGREEERQPLCGSYQQPCLGEGLRKHLQGLTKLFHPLPPCLNQTLLPSVKPRDTAEGWKGDYEWDTYMHTCIQMCTCAHKSFI